MSARRLLGLGAAAASSLIVLTGLAGAAGGDLDQTFGTAGRVLVPIAAHGGWSWNSVIQPDGKIVLVGTNLPEAPPPPPPPPAPRPEQVENEDFVTVRLNHDGSLDSSFGSGGIVRTPIDLDPGARDMARDVALGPDGTIVVAGEASDAGNGYSDLAFVRYTSTGALDQSFSGDGIRTIDVGPQDTGYSVAVQPADGKIVAVGTVGSQPVFQALRMLPDGTLDDSFGTDGIVRTPIGGSAGDYADDLALDGSSIVLAGTADAGTGAGDSALVRYLSDGSLDPSFGGGGIVITPGPEDESIWATRILAGGKILVAGYGGTISSGSAFRLARYLGTGELDPSFGGTGVVTTRIGSNSGAVALVVQADGKAIAGGWSTEGGPGFALARYNEDGSLDSSFGDGGTRTYAVGSRGGDGRGLGIQHIDGDPARERLIQTGTAWDTNGGYFAAIGVQLSGPPPPPGPPPPSGPPPPPPPSSFAPGPPPSPPRCRVPRVVGLRLAAARTKVRRADCSVGRVRQVRARKRRGVVVAQSPRAGVRLVRGGRVTLKVSRGRR